MPLLKWSWCVTSNLVLPTRGGADRQTEFAGQPAGLNDRLARVPPARALPVGLALLGPLDGCDARSSSRVGLPDPWQLFSAIVCAGSKLVTPEDEENSKE